MTIRYYISGFVGNGTILNPYRPRMRQLLPGVEVSIVDGRINPNSATGRCLAWADVTVPQHATLIADSAITYIPLEDADGNVLTLEDTVSEISAANRTTIETGLEALHIPTDDFVGDDLCRKVVRRIALRFQARLLLAALDFDEGLDTTVASIPAGRRSNINTRLTEVGFDTSLIFGTDTIREALRKLFIQANRFLQAIID